MGKTSRGWSLWFTRSAAHTLKRLPVTEQERILAALERAADDPGLGDSKPLHGRDEWTLRVGTWRVLFLPKDGEALQVVRIGSRGDVYKH